MDVVVVVCMYLQTPVLAWAIVKVSDAFRARVRRKVQASLGRSTVYSIYTMDKVKCMCVFLFKHLYV